MSSSLNSQLSAIDSAAAPQFATISGEDWRRALAAARATPNAISAQIRKKILEMKPGNCPNESIRGNP